MRLWNRKTNRPVSSALTLCGAVLGLAMCALSAQAAILIDDFSTGQPTINLDAEAPPIQSAGSFVTPAPGVIGNERDLYGEKILGADGQRTQVQVSALDGALRITNDVALGRAVVTWDGIDGLFGPTQVKYDGLGTLDLSAYTGIELVVGFSDVGGPVKFTLWDGTAGGALYITGTIDVPAGIPFGSPVKLVKDFSEFDYQAESIGDVLKRVGAIQMEVDATDLAQKGWDLQIDSVRIVPEPGSIACWGLLTVAGVVTGIRRRRRSA